MTAMTDDPDHRERDEQIERAGENPEQPFDTSQLNTIPTASDDDPPYRDWWIIDVNEEPSAG